MSNTTTDPNEHTRKYLERYGQSDSKPKQAVLLDGPWGNGLDERAFELDDSSSTPFNLYWTLVNRAYMSHYTRRTQPARQARAWR